MNRNAVSTWLDNLPERFPRLGKCGGDFASLFADNRRILIVSTFLIALLRFALIAGSINDLHTAFTVEDIQTQMARTFLQSDAAEMPGKWRYFIDHQELLLPHPIQFHGMVLLNNVLVWLIASVLGLHYYLLHLLALGYSLLVYLFWGDLIGNKYGRGSLAVFSLLYLFAPLSYVSSSLYLIGSHNEGCALYAVMFWLAFRPHGKAGALTLLTLFGVFFFLYKPVILVLGVLAFPLFRQLKTWAYRLWGLLLLALGFVPPALYHWRFGFYSQYLEDGVLYAGAQRASWTNVFADPSIRPEAFHLPDLGVGIYGFVFSVCFIVLAVRLVRRQERNLLTAAIAIYPALHWLGMSLSTLHYRSQYFTPLYPFIFVIIAVTLGRLRMRIAAPAVVMLLFFAAPPLLAAIRPTQFGLFLHYRGHDYIAHNMNYVPADEVDFVNRTLDICPGNRGFEQMYNVFKSDRWIAAPPRRFEQYKQNIEEFIRLGDWTPAEMLALGITAKTKADHGAGDFHAWLSSLDAPAEAKQWIAIGYRRPDEYLAQKKCPQNPEP